MNYTGVILVGGKGSRLKNLTQKQAKPLLMIGDKPFLDYLLYYISSFNFDKIYLLCSYKHKNFFKRYHKKKILGVSIFCVKEKKPMGTAGALYFLKKKLKRIFFYSMEIAFFLLI